MLNVFFIKYRNRVFSFKAGPEPNSLVMVDIDSLRQWHKYKQCYTSQVIAKILKMSNSYGENYFLLIMLLILMHELRKLNKII